MSSSITSSASGPAYLSVARRYAGTPVLLLAMLAMVTLQLPPFLLDLLFTFNIALSLIVLLVAVYTLRPLEFRVFPTILLITTLLRLALNVASTRVVLLHGHQGGDAAGKVIEAFGNVVIGGNYVVGMVVFTILVIINFVVITKGGGRISEVTARFTLDAMPGKQMAIDADLNAGLIDQDTARKRREEVRQEADFYGAMDGASKFVRGDAVAGLLILAINIIGGVLIGTMQHDLSFGNAFEVYSLLTIGDGLVAQIPSLLLSITAAMMVTRVSDAEDMGTQVSSQMFASPKALTVTAAVMIIMGSVPGMPHMAFLGLGGLAGFLAWQMSKKAKTSAKEQSHRKVMSETLPGEPAEERRDLSWDDVPVVDALGLELGYRLIGLVDRKRGGELLDRIKGIRKNLSTRLGFLIPTVHIRDNLKLAPTDYRISLMGVAVSEGTIHPERLMALNPGRVFGTPKGMDGQDPAYGLPAIWIEQSERDNAVALGWTVVDPATVMATHISKIMDDHAHELLGFDETQKLVDKLASLAPRLADELVPGKMNLTTLRSVLQQLLVDSVPLSDIRTIGGTLLDAAGKQTHPVLLAQEVRVALRRTIIDGIVGMEALIPVVTLAQGLEQLILQAHQKTLQAGGGFAPDAIPLEPNITQQLQQFMPDVTQQMMDRGHAPVLLVAPQLRPLMARFARLCAPDLKVLSYSEIPDDRQVDIVMNLG
ncbi:flagellar biosynthesis protein FlhA [Parendozoicomonas haliclonae]|uniref:Flagellar biosynthesis protein FlhA n=1 Tax=Parendozoicomonas haliclonae TaxID=1960125 RepID=A0A1X7AMV2_9GAMM|nr:flagellar biosynthesis protein FlhA [Parendozoicomonas haliclonae]SMA49614.1 Flagellar biosynthesis protein FlhA [Parendozoicomonas haliclonae]